MIVCMYYPSTRYISILFYTNKHDKIENNFVILENISLLYNAQEFWKCYTRYCQKCTSYQNPSYVNTKNVLLK